MKMETIERIEHMVCEQLEKAQPDWVQSAAKTEHLRNLVSINQKLMCLKEDADGEAYRMGYGGSYRRGRDSMGRYTSYRSYGEPGMGYGMPYEPGYVASDRARTDELKKKLEYLMSRVSPAERQTIQEAMEELNAR